MRHVRIMAIVAGVLATVALSTAGCARDGGSGGATGTGTSAEGKVAEIYIQVLRRYLGTPAENSFPEQSFKTVYVRDRAFPDAGDPDGTHERGTPIAPEVQHDIAAALAGTARVEFVADRNAVIETKEGCAQVRDGGILITLGPANGDDRKVEVAVNGFVACLGATWLTYVVQNEPGAGWRVTGTTGPMTIA